ncbi:MAG: isocitrate/isopropylmalate dehydrogenase family protein [Candidatus Lokiarchaeota archaeon]|nr:isocitrate/isopropylmalate dehydrogenase family protein [Candidatus Lokiarchaeota archaeon]
MKSKKIALIMGDGIGKEVIPEAKQILLTIANHTDHRFDFLEIPAGGEVWKETGQSITDASFEKLRTVDAIVLGALGIPGLPQGVAEYAVLKIRQEFNQYVNLRPIFLYEPLRDICPLKDEFIGDGINMFILRENSEGIYSKIGGKVQDRATIDTMIFTELGVKRILEFAFEFAHKKNHTRICSVDKANLLYTSTMWRSMFKELGEKYPNLEKKSYYIDAFCQWLIRAPYQFQTVVSSNMFGDIISDEAAFLAGSLGMVASANLNPSPNGISMFEPIHGSAPDIAGDNIANPIASILSIGLMMELVFADSYIGEILHHSIASVLETHRTPDIYPKIKEKPKVKKVTTQEMGKLIQNIVSNELRK